MNDFLKEYRGRKSFSRKEAKAILIKFLMVNGRLQDYAKCYNYDHRRFSLDGPLSVEGTIDATIDHMCKYGVFYNRAFGNGNASFSWSTCSKIFNCSIWSDLNEIWKDNIGMGTKIET